MKHRMLITGAAVAALSLAGSLGMAQATIVGAAPDTNFHDSSVAISFGDNATFTFFNDPTATDPLSVKTEGSAEVTLRGGSIPNAPHEPTGVGEGQSLPVYTNIFGQVSWKYDSFPKATPLTTFSFFGPYIGLKFSLNDGIHFGYAKITDMDTLDSYAYNDVAGGGIVTGEAFTPITPPPPTAVPEPSSLAMFGLGLALIGIGAGWMRWRPNRNEVAPQMS